MPIDLFFSAFHWTSGILEYCQRIIQCMLLTCSDLVHPRSHQVFHTQWKAGLRYLSAFYIHVHLTNITILWMLIVTSMFLKQLILDFLDDIVQKPTVLVGNSVGSLACVIAASG